MADPTDQAAPGSAAPDTTNPTPDAPATAPAKPVEAPVYTKTDLTAKIKRETTPLLEKLAAAEARLSEIEAERQKAEDAKLSASQRADKELRTEREKAANDLRAALTTAASERARRHEIMRGHAAARRVAGIAARLFNPDIAQDVEGIVAAALTVEDDGQGGERVAIQLGTPGDTEPLSDDSWRKFVDARLARYFKAEGGSGARHGNGSQPTPATLQAMTPNERIKAGLKARGL